MLVKTEYHSWLAFWCSGHSSRRKLDFSAIVVVSNSRRLCFRGACWSPAGTFFFFRLLSLPHLQGAALTIRWQRDSRSPGPGAAYAPRQQRRPFGERRSTSDSMFSGVDASSSDSRSRTLRPARPGDEHLDSAPIVSVRSVQHARRSLATGSCTPPSGTTQKVPKEQRITIGAGPASPRRSLRGTSALALLQGEWHAMGDGTQRPASQTGQTLCGIRSQAVCLPGVTAEVTLNKGQRYVSSRRRLTDTTVTSFSSSSM